MTPPQQPRRPTSDHPANASAEKCGTDARSVIRARARRRRRWKNASRCRRPAEARHARRSGVFRQHRRARTDARRAALARLSAVVRPPAVVRRPANPLNPGPLVLEAAAEQSGRASRRACAPFSRTCERSLSPKKLRALRSSVEQPRWPADLESGPHGPSPARKLPGRAPPPPALPAQLELPPAVVQAALGAGFRAKHPAERPWRRPR